MAWMLALAGCGPKPATESPDEDFDESSAGSGTRSVSEEERLDQLYGKRQVLPPRPAPQEQCEGTGAEKRCRMVDADPKLVAAHGVRETMANFRWGMDPPAVLERLSAEVKAEFDTAASADALKQDENRRLQEAALAELPKQHVKFGAGAEMWKTSVIARLYRDDATEEMVWFGPPADRRYYLFADGKLWAIVRATNKTQFPGKTYDQIVDTELKKRFGSGATAGELRDDKSGMLKLRYDEWESLDGDRVRAYDLFEAHSSVLLAIFAATAGELAARHPSNELDPALRGGEDLDQVMKESGICYDDKGDMIHDPERCKAIESGAKPAPEGKGAKGKAKGKSKGKGKSGADAP